MQLFDIEEAKVND